MYSHTIKTRIRYSETDKMGYCYYGNYAQFFEMGRVELLRNIGISYKKMEDSGIMLPVSDFKISYLKPVFYDDEITIDTSIRKLPNTRIIFDYQIRNEAEEKTTVGETTLVFIKVENMKPTRPPEAIIAALSDFY